MAHSNFGFPFEPYSIQKEFMSSMVDCIDKGNVGIFESPTGTGKSLSIICAAVTWLRENETKTLQEERALFLDTKIEDMEMDCGDDWLEAHDKKQLIVEERLRVEQTIKLRKAMEDRLINAKSKRGEISMKTFKKRKNEDDEAEEDLASILNDDPDPDHDILIGDSCSGDTYPKELNKKVEEEAEYDCPKVFICSRTHSQLAQLLKEIQKTQFCDSLRVVTLGSRQTLCVNDAVKSLNSLSLINDRCLELQSGSGKQKLAKTNAGTARRSSAKCPFYRKEAMINFSDISLIKGATEMESILKEGRSEKVCPYYSSRLSVPPAQLVLLPYQTLLHQQTRQSCSIKLEGNIVIVDEAHNLLDAISSMHSVSLYGSQLMAIHSQLLQYLQRFSNKLSAANIKALRLLISVVQGIFDLLKASESNSERMHTIFKFIESAHLDEVNLLNVLTYAKQSQLAKKLNYFSQRYHGSVNCTTLQEQKQLTGVEKLLSINKESVKASSDSPESSTPSYLFSLISFLECLVAPSVDGRVLVKVSTKVNESSVVYLLLNPASRLRDITSKCRSVILAGGTMQPASELHNALVHSCQIAKENITSFSCGHVIPCEQLMAIALSKSPCGKVLNLNFETRKKKETLDAIGNVLMNVTRMVPGGVVVFFPSYDFETCIHGHLETSGMLSKLDSKSRIFREPRSTSQVNKVVEDYSRVIRNAGRAQLWAVVGGKLSEGINFSDDLGRCVIMVGLPYPNKNSAQLREKMNYLDRIECGMGQLHYESLCMKAVNQSIGRAIRHKKDYASIILLDDRYSQARIQNSLPSWIRGSLQCQPTFGPVVRLLKTFYDSMKLKSS